MSGFHNRKTKNRGLKNIHVASRMALCFVLFYLFSNWYFFFWFWFRLFLFCFFFGEDKEGQPDLFNNCS